MLVTILAIWFSVPTSTAFTRGSTSPATDSVGQYVPDATANTPNGMRLPVATVPNTNSLMTGFSSTTLPTVGSIQPDPPLAHPAVLGLVLGVIILLCVIISVIIFYLLRVRSQRLPQPPSEPMVKSPLTPSKIHVCQVTEVPELVTNDRTMIDIRSPWSPINPRKPESPDRN